MYTLCLCLHGRAHNQLALLQRLLEFCTRHHRRILNHHPASWLNMVMKSVKPGARQRATPSIAIGGRGTPRLVKNYLLWPPPRVREASAFRPARGAVGAF